MQNICLLGATGSIGDSTLHLIAQNADHFNLTACSAWQNIQKAQNIIKRFHPKYMVVANAELAQQLNHQLTQNDLKKTEILYGEQALSEIATLDNIDTVVAAIVGSAGLASAFAAAQAGKKILLANKEVLVAAGTLFFKNCHPDTQILPLDSEHNAIFQCLSEFHQYFSLANKSIALQNIPIHQQNIEQHVESLILTASGGPFLLKDLNEFEDITPAMACKHPKWSMGQKISVDSATMMNKGLEVIEAHYLFNMPLSKIEVVIHPQSIIHSMVKYVDGSILAQMSNPDMRVPIIHALAYPKRLPYNAKPIDWLNFKLDFTAIDFQRYPCLKLAKEALNEDKCNILNAANEIAVAAFLSGKIKFTDISYIIEKALNQSTTREMHDLDDVLQVDQEARRLAYNLIQKNIY